MTRLALAGMLTAALLLTPTAAPATSAADSGPANAVAINNRGEIVGVAFTPERKARAVRWLDGSWARELGTLGGPESRAWGINDLGEIVGEAQTASGAWHAFRYTESDGIRDLGMLPGATSCAAYDINDRSEVTGTCKLPIDGGGLRSRAVLWSGGRVIPLLTYHSHEDTEAHGINDRGEITGFGEDYNRLTVWAKGERIGLPTLPTVSACCHDPELNDSGQIIVNDYDIAARSNVGQLWTPDRSGNYAEPTVIDVGRGGNLRDVNEAADVVGDRSTSDGPRAFIWSRGTITELVPLPGSRDSYAVGVNDRRDVVGASLTQSGSRAVAWTNGEVIELDGLPTE